MKTVGPAKAKDGNTKVAMVFSVEPEVLHKILMADGEEGLNLAISEFIQKEIDVSRVHLFISIRELVMTRQAQIEATGV